MPLGTCDSSFSLVFSRSCGCPTVELSGGADGWLKVGLSNSLWKTQPSCLPRPSATSGWATDERPGSEIRICAKIRLLTLIIFEVKY